MEFARTRAESAPKKEVVLSWDEEKGVILYGDEGYTKKTRGEEYTWRHQPMSRDWTEERLKGLLYFLDHQSDFLTAGEIWRAANGGVGDNGVITSFRLWLTGFQVAGRQLIGNGKDTREEHAVGIRAPWRLFVDQHHALVADASLRIKIEGSAQLPLFDPEHPPIDETEVIADTLVDYSAPAKTGLEKALGLLSRGLRAGADAIERRNPEQK